MVGPGGVFVGGVAGVAVAGASGVTTNCAVTFPWIPFFCFADFVPRAWRVALRFSAAIAYCNAVIGAGTLGASRPKSINA